jgi:hypothetical protein
VDRDAVTLTMPGSRTPRHVRFWLDGGDLRRSWWAGAGKARDSLKVLGDRDAARAELEKAAVRKMREGYVELRAVDETEPGGVVFHGLLPRHSNASMVAFHPDGHTLALAVSIHEGGREVHFVDLQTGVRVVADKDPNPDAMTRTLAFDADGSHVTFTAGTRSSMIETTYALSPVTGRLRELPYLRPQWDDAHRRVLVRDDSALRVFGPDGEPCLDVPVTSRWTSPSTLSPSGQLLAVARFSANYSTCDLEIWEVEGARRVLSVPFPFPDRTDAMARYLLELAFDATERLLVASGGFHVGCYGVSVDTGELRWTIAGSTRGAYWYERFEALTMSPDRTVLVGVPVQVSMPERVTAPAATYDVTTGQRLAPTYETPGESPYAATDVAVSPDGRLVAVTHISERVTVFRAILP